MVGTSRSCVRRGGADPAAAVHRPGDGPRCGPHHSGWGGCGEAAPLAPGGTAARQGVAACRGARRATCAARKRCTCSGGSSSRCRGSGCCATPSLDRARAALAPRRAVTRDDVRVATMARYAHLAKTRASGRPARRRSVSSLPAKQPMLASK